MGTSIRNEPAHPFGKAFEDVGAAQAAPRTAPVKTVDTAPPLPAVGAKTTAEKKEAARADLPGHAPADLKELARCEPTQALQVFTAIVSRDPASFSAALQAVEQRGMSAGQMFAASSPDDWPTRAEATKLFGNARHLAGILSIAEPLAAQPGRQLEAKIADQTSLLMLLPALATAPFDAARFNPVAHKIRDLLTSEVVKEHLVALAEDRNPVIFSALNAFEKSLVKHSIKHDLPPAQAKAVLAHAFASYAERYPKYAPTLDWTNDREATFGFDVRGKTLRGRAAVNASDIAVELDVPFVFAMFKSVAVQRLDEEAQKWINKAKAGEL